MVATLAAIDPIPTPRFLNKITSYCKRVLNNGQNICKINTFQSEFPVSAAGNPDRPRKTEIDVERMCTALSVWVDCMAKAQFCLCGLRVVWSICVHCVVRSACAAYAQPCLWIVDSAVCVWYGLSVCTVCGVVYLCVLCVVQSACAAYAQPYLWIVDSAVCVWYGLSVCTVCGVVYLCALCVVRSACAAYAQPCLWIVDSAVYVWYGLSVCTVCGVVCLWCRLPVRPLHNPVCGL